MHISNQHESSLNNKQSRFNAQSALLSYCIPVLEGPPVKLWNSSSIIIIMIRTNYNNDPFKLSLLRRGPYFYTQILV